MSGLLLQQVYLPNIRKLAGLLIPSNCDATMITVKIYKHTPSVNYFSSAIGSKEYFIWYEQ